MVPSRRVSTPFETTRLLIRRLLASSGTRLLRRSSENFPFSTHSSDYSRGPLLLRAELAPELARAHRLEGDQRTHQPRKDGQDDQRGDRHRYGDERAAEDRYHQPGNAQAALLAQPEGVVPQKVEANPTAQRHGRYGSEWIADVAMVCLIPRATKMIPATIGRCK